MTLTSRFASLPHLTDEAVAAFADNVLGSGPRARAEHHLHECPDCAAAVAEQRQARSVLQSAAIPTVPMSLLERLRGLPASVPMGEPGRSGGLPLAGLSADGHPVFAAFDSRPRIAEFSIPTPVPATPVSANPVPATPAPTAAIPATPAPSLPTPTLPTPTAGGHRRWAAPVVGGVSAAAVATLLVGLLATTATNAGGSTAPVTPEPASVTPAPGPTASIGAATPILSVLGTH